MRKIVLSAALAGTVLTLSACGEGAEQPSADADTMDETMADTDTMETADAGGVVDANSATDEELMAMNGMSQQVVDAITSGRPYSSVTELNTVLTGVVSEEEAATIRERVFVPVNLNTATREELALIPGIDDRMIHEFEEYVPYEDMEEFDREIGKYVDADEVARYRQYVTL